MGHILFVSVGTITGVNATLAVDANLPTNIPSVPVNTPLRHAEPNKCNLYSLGISPINVKEFSDGCDKL
jgi:hypothetical protein